MRCCRNCYYRSIIGFESWCCHPAIGDRISDTGKSCADHVYLDAKMVEKVAKTPYAEMIKRRIKPKEKNYKITHAGTAILCKKCGYTSFNPDDVTFKFCGKCKEFYDDA